MNTGNVQSSPSVSAEASLFETYGAIFTTVRARSRSQLEECFRLRYQVYCVENLFLPVAENPGELETDEYDEQSTHAMLVHASSGATVGTVRLVLPATSSMRAPLPLYASCPEALKQVPVERTAEISRFAISKRFRRRRGDDLYGQFYTRAELNLDDRRLIPHLTLGLMQAVVDMAEENGMDHICAIMDPALLRLLARFGIHFTLIGEPVEYHGLRQPCYSHLRELLARVEEERFDVWEVITQRGRLLRSAPAIKARPRAALASMAGR